MLHLQGPHNSEQVWLALPSVAVTHHLMCQLLQWESTPNHCLQKKNDNNKDAAESQNQIFSYTPTHFHCLQMLQSKTLYLVSMQPLLINKSLDVQIA